MGRDKALLELGGKPLVEHAVAKLRRVCGDVAICSGNAVLAGYAPLVPDIHPGCGPMSGMEAALLGAQREWNLFLPVDVPFLPTLYLYAWLQALELARLRGARVMLWTVDEFPQPTVSLVHRDVGPFLTQAIGRGEYKLTPVLERAAKQSAACSGFAADAGLWKMPYWAELRSSGGAGDAPAWRCLTEAQRRYSAHWFDNLNRPDEFAEAERHVDALDT